MTIASKFCATSCVAALAIAAAPLPAAAAWPPAIERSLVLVGDCASFEPPAGAAGAGLVVAEKLVGTAIDVGLTTLFGAIRKAGEDKTSSDFMVGTANLSKSNGQCLIALRGKVQDLGPDADNDQDVADATDSDTFRVRIRNELESIYKLRVERLDFYWEASIHFDPSAKAAFRLATRTLVVNDVLDPKRLDKLGPSLVMTVAFTAPGVSDIAAATVTQAETFAYQLLGRVRPAKANEAGGAYVAHYASADTAPTTPWLVLPKVEEDGKTVAAPRTVWVVRTETSDGNRFMKALSAILEPNKADIKNAITGAVLPSVRAQATATAEQAARTKYYEAMRAYADAETKVAACLKSRADAEPPGDRIRTCTDARQAQDLANTAAAAAVLAAFYPDAKLIDPTS